MWKFPRLHFLPWKDIFYQGFQGQILGKFLLKEKGKSGNVAAIGQQVIIKVCKP